MEENHCVITKFIYMKDFLNDILIEPFSDGDFMGVIMGIIMWIVTLFISFMLFWGLYYVVDSSFMPIKEKHGIVVGTKYTAPHSSTTYSHVGNVMVPHTTYYDESFYVVVEIDGLTDDVQINEWYYNQVKKGEILNCSYTNGRIGNSLYIKTIEPN